MKGSLDPEVRLQRTQLAEPLTKGGFSTAASTLATKATRVGGPPYRPYGRPKLYRWGDAVAWAESRLSPPRSSTTELDAA